MKMHRYLILAFCILISSCVHLKTPQRDDLVRLKASMAIGKYPINSERTFKTRNEIDTTVVDTIWSYFTDSVVKDKSRLAKATHIELYLIDKKHIKSILFNGNTPMDTGIIKGRLRKGYFRTHDLSFTGIPPFYWSMSSAKMQFGLGKEKQLYIDTADETSGSILIFGASMGGFTRSRIVPAFVR